jgi:DNA repair exonuclease SbcCD ATPase subunit
MGGSTLKNLNMFEALCGTTDLSHVVLATTMWDKMADPDNRKKAIRFEQDLQRDYWGDMIEFGSKTFHHDDTKGSAMQIVNHILSLRGDNVLDIQREMIDQKRSLDQTAAGQQLQKDLLEERKRHEKLLKEAQEAHQAAIKAGNKRMMDAMEKQERRHTEKLKEFEKGLDEEKNNIRKDFERLQEEGRKRYQDMIDRAERDKRSAEENARAAEAELRKVRTKQEGIDAKMKKMEEDSNEKESRLLAQLAKEAGEPISDGQDPG